MILESLGVSEFWELIIHFIWNKDSLVKKIERLEHEKLDVLDQIKRLVDTYHDLKQIRQYTDEAHKIANDALEHSKLATLKERLNGGN